MATPEQNTALGLQLFQPATRVVTDANDNRVALLTRIAEIQNQQRFQQEQLARQQAFAGQQQTSQQQFLGQQATQQQGAAVNLEKLRAQNSRDLAADAEKRQRDVGKQQQDAADLRDLHRQFALSYPIYAHAAAVLGQKPTPISDYDETWEGLGEMQGDMQILKEKADKQEKGAAAQGVVAILDQATQQLSDAIKARDDGIKLTADDQSQARSMGLRALQQAANTGAIPGLDPKDKKFQQAVAALSKDTPDIAVASQILGPSGIQAYAGGVQQGLLGLANDKERLAKIAALNRDVQSAQRGASDSLTRLMTLTATNPELGGMLQERSKTLNSLTPQAAQAPAQTDTQSVFKSLIGNPPAAAQAPAPQASTGPSFLDRAASVFARPPSPLTPAGLGGGPTTMSSGLFGAPTPLAPAQAPAAPSAPLTSTLSALAPQTPAPQPDNTLPPEVAQAAAMIANSRTRIGTEPYQQILQSWLDNNGIGRPWSQDNVNLRRLLQPVTAGY